MLRNGYSYFVTFFNSVARSHHVKHLSLVIDSVTSIRMISFLERSHVLYHTEVGGSSCGYVGKLLPHFISLFQGRPDRKNYVCCDDVEYHGRYDQIDDESLFPFTHFAIPPRLP